MRERGMVKKVWAGWRGSHVQMLLISLFLVVLLSLFRSYGAHAVNREGKGDKGRERRGNRDEEEKLVPVLFLFLFLFLSFCYRLSCRWPCSC